MPGFVSICDQINSQFTPANIRKFAKHRDKFKPGKMIDPALIFTPGTPDYRQLTAYLNQLPKPLHNILRGLIHDALDSAALTQMIFTWAPGYDNELTIWHPECGISVLVKSREMREVSDETA
jgi:hypothetical protein